MSKRMIFGAMAAAGLVAILSILDLALGFPFARQITLDVLFLLSAGVVIYMAYDAYQEQK